MDIKLTTIQPVLKKTTTPTMFITHDVNTPRNNKTFYKNLIISFLLSEREIKTVSYQPTTSYTNYNQ